MINELIGMYLSDKYSILTDRIVFALSIDANKTTSFTLTDATNGLKLKNDLVNLDYFLTKYAIWSQNGILDVSIKPDNEATNQIKTFAFTQKTESPITPAKYVQTDLSIELTNDQDISDDLLLVIDIFKIPSTNVPELINIGKAFCISPDDIDIQTLAIEKYIIYTNELLKALILANGGTVPEVPSRSIIETPESVGVCRRA